MTDVIVEARLVKRCYYSLIGILGIPNLPGLDPQDRDRLDHFDNAGLLDQLGASLPPGQSLCCFPGGLAGRRRLGGQGVAFDAGQAGG